MGNSPLHCHCGHVRLLWAPLWVWGDWFIGLSQRHTNEPTSANLTRCFPPPQKQAQKIGESLKSLILFLWPKAFKAVFPWFLPKARAENEKRFSLLPFGWRVKSPYVRFCRSRERALSTLWLHFARNRKQEEARTVDRKWGEDRFSRGDSTVQHWGMRAQIYLARRSIFLLLHFFFWHIPP